MYDGAQWVVVSEGVIGYNTTGSTIDAGSIVKLKTSTTGSLGMRQEINPCTSKHDRPDGILLQSTLNGAVGVIITKGRVLTVKKLTGTAVTNGDSLVPSATSGAATTGNVSGYGSVFGASAIGIWTNDAAAGATSGEAYIWGSNRATWVAYLTTPSQRLTAAVPATDDTWSASFGTPQNITWSVTPPGVIARLVQVRVHDVTAAADRNVSFGIRQQSSGLEVGSGAPSVAGQISTQAVTTDAFKLAGQLWVPTDPAAAAGDIAEYKVTTRTSAGAAGTIANYRVDLWELAAMIGGRVV